MDAGVVLALSGKLVLNDSKLLLQSLEYYFLAGLNCLFELFETTFYGLEELDLLRTEGSVHLVKSALL